MDNPTETVPPQGGPPWPGPSPGAEALERGATVGRYVVLDRLGAGGMGVVYAAYDPELDRKVALKLLRAGAPSAASAGRARLLREAQALARLSHPNVVAVYDVGTFGERRLHRHGAGRGADAARSGCAGGPRSWREVAGRVPRRRPGARGRARAPGWSIATSSPTTC